MKALFFLHGNFMGEGEVEPRLSARGLQLTQSLAFFCPQCGDIWARIAVEGRRWYVQHAACPHCEPDSAFMVQGSLWSEFDSELNNALPPGLLAREVALHLSHYERNEA